MAEAGGGAGSTSALQEFDAELQNQIADTVTELNSRSETAFASAAEQLQIIRETCSAIVDQLVAEADRATTLITQAEDALRQRFSTLHDEQATHDAGLNDAQSAVATGLDNVDQGVQAFETAGGDLENGAQDRLRQFVDAVQNALDALRQAMDATEQQVRRFEDALRTLGQDTEQNAEETEQALQTLGDRLTELIDTARDTLEQTSQRAQQQLESDFKTAMSDLEQIGGQALDAIDALMRNADDTGNSIGDDIREVLDLINKVVDVIERIRPVLELAEQLS